jgi:hypothetical protein
VSKVSFDPYIILPYSKRINIALEHLAPNFIAREHIPAGTGR